MINLSIAKLHSTAKWNERSKTEFENKNSEENFQNRDFFPGQIWSCDRRYKDNPGKLLLRAAASKLKPLRLPRARLGFHHTRRQERKIESCSLESHVWGLCA